MGTPKIKADPLYKLLRDGKVDDFNRLRAAGKPADVSGCDFRDCDLRGLEAGTLDFSDSYFRQADIRGIDFRKARIEGASIHHAKISGTYFPDQLVPEEITMSVLYGTRLRYAK